MTRLRSFLIPLFVLVCGTSPAAGKANVDSLLVAARDTTLSDDARIDLLKEAAKDDKTGRAAYEIARLHVAMEDRGKLRGAEAWIGKAIRRQKNNADYRALSAEIKWRRGSRKGAYKEAMKAIDADPNQVEALYWAARYSEWVMRRFDETVRTEVTYDEQYESHANHFSLSEYGDEGREDAISYLTRALDLDPGHRPSRILLGLVYYESYMAEELVALYKKHLAREPDDATGYFVLGLGYGVLKDLPRSYAAYVEGLRLMSVKEQMFMTSVFMLTDGDPESPPPDQEAIRSFWIGRDPLYMTPVNERMMEHCSRVAYANLRFGDPVVGLKGWQTHKGQAYIRYGRPRNRIVRPAEIDTGIDEPQWYQEYLVWRDNTYGILGGSLFEEHKRTEMWDYGGFVIFFENPNRDRWQFQIAWQHGIPLGFSTLTDLIPEVFVDPYAGDRYDADYQIGQFRGDEGKTRLEISYALPVERVEHEDVRMGVKKVDVKQGLFLFDARWDTLMNQVGRVEMMPWVQYDPARKGFLFASERLGLEPGTYFMAGEVQDRKSKSVGTFREALDVRDFSGDSLQVSSLMLARRVVERQNAPFGRDRYLILPNPVGRCERDGQASFYFEVYNLARNEFGVTHYEVTYQIQGLTEEGDDDELEWSTAVSYTREGNTVWEPNYLALELDEVMPGLRALRVVVNDLVAGREAVARTLFRVMW